MYYVVDIEEDWYIKGSKDHYEMSYTGDLDTVFRTQNKDTAFQVSDKCNEKRNGNKSHYCGRQIPAYSTNKINRKKAGSKYRLILSSCISVFK